MMAGVTAAVSATADNAAITSRRIGPSLKRVEQVGTAHSTR
jgi:hypothetical protein